MIPKYPFHLTVFWANGRKQVITFETAGAALAAAARMRPALVRSWELAMIIEARHLGEQSA